MTNTIGELIRSKRTSLSKTVTKISNETGISQAHLGRIERGERLPSAKVLRKLAGPLGFSETELFTLAGFLSSKPDDQPGLTRPSGLDPFVAASLAAEPPEVQRAVLGILSLLKSLRK